MKRMMTMTWAQYMNVQKKMQKEQGKIRKRRVGMMSNKRETRQRCNSCDISMMWNLENRCEEHVTRDSSENMNAENVEITNDTNVEIEESRVSERRSVRRQRCSEIKIRGGVMKMKDKGIMRLFSVNSNGFGPGSSDEIDQIIRESEGRHIDGIMISSSDTGRGTVNRSMIENKLKNITSKKLNASDSKKTLDSNEPFLKEGTMTAIWNDAVNHTKIEECTENKNG